MLLRPKYCNALLFYCVTVQDFQRAPRCPPITPVGERSFASAGPRLWNSLPDDITIRHNHYHCSVSKKTANLPISAIILGHYTIVSDCFPHGGHIAVTFYFKPL